MIQRSLAFPSTRLGGCKTATIQKKRLVMRLGGLTNEHTTSWRNWFHTSWFLSCHVYTSVLSSFHINICIGGHPSNFSSDRPEQTLHSQQIDLAERHSSHITVGCWGGRRSFRIGKEIRQGTKVKIWEDWAATPWTFHIQSKPLVNAFNMEIMCTRQATNLQHN